MRVCSRERTFCSEHQIRDIASARPCRTSEHAPDPGRAGDALTAAVEHRARLLKAHTARTARTAHNARHAPHAPHAPSAHDANGAGTREPSVAEESPEPPSPPSRPDLGATRGTGPADRLSEDPASRRGRVRPRRLLTDLVVGALDEAHGQPQGAYRVIRPRLDGARRNTEQLARLLRRPAGVVRLVQHFPVLGRQLPKASLRSKEVSNLSTSSGRVTKSSSQALPLTSWGARHAQPVVVDDEVAGHPEQPRPKRPVGVQVLRAPAAQQRLLHHVLGPVSVTAQQPYHVGVQRPGLLVVERVQRAFPGALRPRRTNHGPTHVRTTPSMRDLVEVRPPSRARRPRFEASVSSKVPHRFDVRLTDGTVDSGDPEGGIPRRRRRLSRHNHAADLRVPAQVAPVSGVAVAAERACIRRLTSRTNVASPRHHGPVPQARTTRRAAPGRSQRRTPGRRSAARRQTRASAPHGRVDHPAGGGSARVRDTWWSRRSNSRTGTPKTPQRVCFESERVLVAEGAGRVFPQPQGERRRAFEGAGIHGTGDARDEDGEFVRHPGGPWADHVPSANGPAGGGSADDCRSVPAPSGSLPCRRIRLEPSGATSMRVTSPSRRLSITASTGPPRARACRCSASSTAMWSGSPSGTQKGSPSRFAVPSRRISTSMGNGDRRDVPSCASWSCRTRSGRSPGTASLLAVLVTDGPGDTTTRWESAVGSCWGTPPRPAVSWHRVRSRGRR